VPGSFGRYLSDISLVEPCLLPLTLIFPSFFFVRIIFCCLIIVISPPGVRRSSLILLGGWWLWYFNSYKQRIPQYTLRHLVNDICTITDNCMSLRTAPAVSNSVYTLLLIMSRRASIDIDFGRSNGRPRARAQTSCVNAPSARETPKITV